MPLVTVKWFKGRTKIQKEEIAKAITESIVKIGKAPLDQTWVIFEEVEKENWSIGARLME